MRKSKLLFVLILSIFMFMPFKVFATNISVKTITGQNIIIDIDLNDSVDTLKTKIQEKLNIPPYQQKLTFAGQQLESGKTLSEYNIQKESTIFLTYTLKLINVKYKIENLNDITNNVTDNGTLDDGSFIVSGLKDFTAKLEPNEGYKLPTLISIYINEILIDSESYTYNSETGEILISKDLIDGDIIIEAIAEKIDYKVVFDANGGKFTDSDKYIIDDIVNFDYTNFNKPTREGYRFIGFFTEIIGGKSFEEVMNSEAGIEEDTTFYARWEKNSSGGAGTADIDEENPKTFDGIGTSIFMGIISLIGLVGTTLYLKKKNKVRAND